MHLPYGVRTRHRHPDGLVVLQRGDHTVDNIGRHQRPRRVVYDEFTNGGRLRLNHLLFPVVWFLIKWVAPVAVVIIFFTNFIL